jgi:hypothetical protein
MTRDDLATYLENAGASLLDATEHESLEVRAAALVANGLLRLGASLARQGLAPVEHITRLIDIDPDMEKARKEAQASADAKFNPPDTLAPVTGPADPDGNPYDP